MDIKQGLCIIPLGAMTMPSTGNKINACRPGSGASCALCCGSHNCDAAPADIDALYRSRGGVVRLYSRDYLVKRVIASRSPMTGSYYFTGKRDIELPDLPPLVDAERCPFIGIVGDMIGCLLHGGPESSLRYECHKNYSSKNFTCVAKERLGDEEILYAANLCRDWYYYSLLIYYDDRLFSILRDYPHPGEVPARVYDKLKDELRAAVLADPEIHRMLTYF